MKEIYSIGYTRAGSLRTFYNQKILPQEISVDDLQLEQMVPAEGSSRQSILFKPLLGGAWYLLAGIHKINGDRSAPVVAGRILNREAATELLAEPELLLRLGAFLRDEETPERVSKYGSSPQMATFDRFKLPKWADCFPDGPDDPDEVKQLIFGVLCALQNQHDALQFTKASAASLKRVLELLPVCLGLNCGFSLYFNGASGLCTDLNIQAPSDSIDPMKYPGDGWPAKARINLQAQYGHHDVKAQLIETALLSLNHHRTWDQYYCHWSVNDTLHLLVTLGIVLEFEQTPSDTSAALAVQGTLKIDAQKADHYLTALSSLIGEARIQGVLSRPASKGHTQHPDMDAHAAANTALNERGVKSGRRNVSWRAEYALLLTVAAAVLVLIAAASMCTFDIATRTLQVSIRFAVNLPSLLTLVSCALGSFCLGKLSECGRKKRNH